MLRAPFVGTGPFESLRAPMRNVSRADAIAVGNGGKPLDVYAEDSGEHLGLHLAELWELLGDVSDWTVMLAELLTDRGRQRRGDIAVVG